jgi:hypothetical protein
MLACVLVVVADEPPVPPEPLPPDPPGPLESVPPSQPATEIAARTHTQPATSILFMGRRW